MSLLISGVVTINDRPAPTKREFGKLLVVKSSVSWRVIRQVKTHDTEGNARMTNYCRGFASFKFFPSTPEILVEAACTPGTSLFVQGYITTSLGPKGENYYDLEIENTELLPRKREDNVVNEEQDVEEQDLVPANVADEDVPF